MTPTTAFDVSTLRWVGKEIDKSLGEAAVSEPQFLHAHPREESGQLDAGPDTLANTARRFGKGAQQAPR